MPSEHKNEEEGHQPNGVHPADIAFRRLGEVLADIARHATETASPEQYEANEDPQEEDPQ